MFQMHIHRMYTDGDLHAVLQAPNTDTIQNSTYAHIEHYDIAANGYVADTNPTFQATATVHNNTHNVHNVSNGTTAVATTADRGSKTVSLQLLTHSVNNMQQQQQQQQQQQYAYSAIHTHTQNTHIHGENVSGMSSLYAPSQQHTHAQQAHMTGMQVGHLVLQCIYVCLCLWTYVCVCIYAYIYMCVYVHIYISSICRLQLRT